MLMHAGANSITLGFWCSLHDKYVLLLVIHVIRAGGPRSFAHSKRRGSVWWWWWGGWTTHPLLPVFDSNQ